jgi:transposase
MSTVITIGLDIAKSVFQVHGIDAEGTGLMALFSYSGEFGQAL